jgi:hypothetical protein
LLQQPKSKFEINSLNSFMGIKKIGPGAKRPLFYLTPLKKAIVTDPQ